MPIFGYECSSCGEEFELWEPCKEAGDAPFCPKCGAAKPQEHKYRMCRYWRMAFSNDPSKAQHIRPGSWA